MDSASLIAEIERAIRRVEEAGGTPGKIIVNPSDDFVLPGEILGLPVQWNPVLPDGTIYILREDG